MLLLQPYQHLLQMNLAAQLRRWLARQLALQSARLVVISQP
jgi:hypothetical protein